MHRRPITLLLLLALLCPAVALAAPVTLAWDPNPPAEQVTEYAVFRDGVEVWAGPGQSYTDEVAPGVYTYTVRARNGWGESADSLPVSTPGVATAPMTVTITVTVTLN